jgi:hypothetical protein
MRASPKAFFLEKAMNLKGTKSTHIELNSEGKIVIEQWSDDLEQPVTIYLSPEQMTAINNWSFAYSEEIKLAWKHGVQNEPKT